MNKNALSIITLVGGIGLVKQITGSLSKTSKLTVLNHHFKIGEPIPLLFLPKNGYWDEYVKSYLKQYDVEDFLDLDEQLLYKQLEEQKITSNEYLNKIHSAYKKAYSKVKKLKEKDFKNLLLEHYTFIKRPILMYDEKIFVGNSPKTILEAIKFINEQ